jgi:hypothetical protein
VSPERRIFYVTLAVAAFILLAIIIKMLPKRVRKEKFKHKWNEIQKQCGNKQDWAQVVIAADELLDLALKKKRIKGKTMGERLVAAQKKFSDNDGVWYAHKLRKKLEASSDVQPKKEEVKKALFGIRQGLKDMDVL